MLAERWTRWRGSCLALLMVWTSSAPAADALAVSNSSAAAQPSPAAQPQRPVQPQGPVPPLGSAHPAVSAGASMPAQSSDPARNDGLAEPAAGGRWSVLARSGEDRAIEYRQFGQGALQVLVVGPLEGDSTTGVRLVELLAEHLERFPRRLADATVTLVRDPNPDGRFRHAAGNARGVLIDQNFGTRAWRKAPAGGRWLSGRTPDSESETRALADLLADVRPDRVVVIGASHRLPELAFIGPAEAAGRRMEREARLPLGRIDPAVSYGSLAAFAGERGIGALVLRVPDGLADQTVWETYKRTLLSGMTFEPSEGDGQAAQARGGEAAPMSAPAAASGSKPSDRLASLTARKPVAATDAPTRGDRLRREAVPETEGRVLSAAELRLGGTVVPVAPRRRERPPEGAGKDRSAAGAGIATSPPRSVGATLASPPRTVGPTEARGGSLGWRTIAPRPLSTSQPFANRQLAAPRNLPAQVPAARLGNQRIPNASRANHPIDDAVERLPPVDPSQRAPQPTAPQPIPLYPETGY
jgi:hypothetical protein